MKTNPGEMPIRIGTLAKSETGAPYLRDILPHGFESFSITFGRSLDGIDLPRLAAEVQQVLNHSGATISSLGIYGNPLEEESLDLQTRRGFEELIEHAHLFGTNVVAGFTGRKRGLSIPDSIEAFKNIFTPLASRAAERGVKIAFENCAMGGTWKSGDWNIAHNPDAWELMFEALPLPNLGLQWEPCHQMIALIEPLPQIATWCHRIFHVHGKCANIHWDVVRKHGIFGCLPFAFHRHPGFGDCDWSTIISQLRQHGFTGSIDIEGWHDPIYKDEREMEGQVHALQYLKKCRTEVLKV